MTDKDLVAQNKKYLLIDLDGTLVDTANIALKPMKDGQVETDLSQIKIFDGAVNFLTEAKNLGFECIVLSDSHPKYVNTIVRKLFGNIAALSLADKPNTLKTLGFFRDQRIDLSSSTCYLIGDSWLDIELGRGLGIPTILTEFYETKQLEVRDGIGDYKKNITSGSTYFAKKYSEVLEILRDPLGNLLCLEAGIIGVKSYIARKPRSDVKNLCLTAHRVLARQASGECDPYHATEKYLEFNRADRSKKLLDSIRDSVVVYLERVLSAQSYSWDILTYVPDKRTTQPANKMGELFQITTEKIEQKTSQLECLNIFDWSADVDSSTRKQLTAIDRRNFLRKYLNLCPEIDISGKNIIVIDDQYTTGATADVLVEKLRASGVRNILFIALFHLVASVDSAKLCPDCLGRGLTKHLQVKINRDTGNKFYSCVLPKYGGSGCGYTENI